MIGERMKALRKIKGYSISKLASLAGVSKSYLSYIERGIQENPSLQILEKIAVTLDTTIEYLLGEPQDPTEYEIQIDKEWELILKESIQEGLSKEDFLKVRDYILFKNWSDGNQKKQGGKQ